MVPSIPLHLRRICSRFWCQPCVQGILWCWIICVAIRPTLCVWRLKTQVPACSSCHRTVLISLRLSKPLANSRLSCAAPRLRHSTPSWMLLLWRSIPSPPLTRSASSSIAVLPMFVNSLSYLENAVVSSIFAIPLTAYGIFNLNEFILRHNFGLDVIVGIAVPLFLLIIVIVTAVRQWSKIGEDLSNGKV